MKNILFDKNVLSLIKSGKKVMFAESASFREKPLEVGEHFTINDSDAIYTISEKWENMNFEQLRIFETVGLEGYSPAYIRYLNECKENGELIVYTFETNRKGRVKSIVLPSDVLNLIRDNKICAIAFPASEKICDGDVLYCDETVHKNMILKNERGLLMGVYGFDSNELKVVIKILHAQPFDRKDPFPTWFKELSSCRFTNSGSCLELKNSLAAELLICTFVKRNGLT